MVGSGSDYSLPVELTVNGNIQELGSVDTCRVLGLGAMAGYVVLSGSKLLCISTILVVLMVPSLAMVHS